MVPTGLISLHSHKRFLVSAIKLALSKIPSKENTLCSLYPYICKTSKFPVEHSKVYVSEECRELTGPSGIEIDKVEDLVHCTVLLTRTLYHPVLPVQMHDILMFALCRLCCENMCQTDCTENVTDREFTGCLVVHEIRKAVSVGYKITNIYEIWQYEVTQYSSQTKERESLHRVYKYVLKD